MHYFASGAVAIGLFGMITGATTVYLLRRESAFIQLLKQDGFLWLSTAVAVFWLASITIEVDPLAAVIEKVPWELSELALLLGAYSLPLYVVGAILALLLSSNVRELRRLYAADLVAGGAGSFAAFWIGNLCGPLAYLLVLAVTALVWQMCLWRSHHRSPSLGAVVWTAALGLGIAFGALQSPDLRYPPTKALHRSSHFIERTRWDWASRIDVLAPTAGYFPGGGAISKPESDPPFSYRLVTLDGGAPTAFLGDDGGLLERPVFGRYLQAAPYALLRHPRVLVLGSGGGLDVLIALAHGAEAVVAVEVNARILGLLQREYHDYTGGWVDSDRVSVFLEEGRRFLERSSLQHDLIVLAGVDTFSSGAGGTNALVENYLYTREGLALALSRLSGGGVLSVLRWNLTPPRESLRLVHTLIAALGTIGVNDPSRCIVVLEGGGDGKDAPWAHLLVKPTGFDLRGAFVLQRWAEQLDFDVLSAPDLLFTNPFSELLRLAPPQRVEYARRYPYDISVSTDDRPYLFVSAGSRGMLADIMRFLRPRSLASQATGRRAELTLGVALQGGMLLFAMLCAIIGWTFLRRVHLASRLPSRRSGLFFIATGAGGLLIEVSLFQQGALFLGMPSLAIAAVLVGFTLGSGLGALFFANRRWGPWGAATLALLPLVCEERVILRVLAETPAPLAGIAFALWSAALGVAAGSCFPAGARVLLHSEGRAVPAALALGTLASMLAALYAPIQAYYYGRDSIWLLALVCYLIAAWMLLSSSSHRSTIGAATPSLTRTEA